MPRPCPRLFPPDELGFREVVRLAGEIDGTAPWPPVAVGPEGTFLSATYSPGEIAEWSATGQLQRVIGNGEGSGPGESRRAQDIVIGPDSVVNIMTGGTRWHRYSPTGDFMETVSLPTVAGAGEAIATADGTLLTWVRSREGPQMLAWDGSDIRSVGPRAAAGSSFRLATSGHGTFWSAESTTYRIRRHNLPDGLVNLTLTRDPAGYRARGRTPSASPSSLPTTTG